MYIYSFIYLQFLREIEEFARTVDDDFYFAFCSVVGCVRRCLENIDFTGIHGIEQLKLVALTDYRVFFHCEERNSDERFVLLCSYLKKSGDDDRLFIDLDVLHYKIKIHE